MSDKYIRTLANKSIKEIDEKKSINNEIKNDQVKDNGVDEKAEKKKRKFNGDNDNKFNDDKVNVSIISDKLKAENKPQFKTGNILDATETFIAHQCNCITSYGLGLSDQMFKKFPWSNIYSPHSPFSRKRNPGKIILAGNGKDKRYVINMLGQISPGPAGKFNVPAGKFISNGVNNMKIRETNEKRIEWFKQCLDQVGLLVSGQISLPLPIDVTSLPPHTDVIEPPPPIGSNGVTLNIKESTKCDLKSLRSMEQNYEPNNLELRIDKIDPVTLASLDPVTLASLQHSSGSNLLVEHSSKPAMPSDKGVIAASNNGVIVASNKGVIAASNNGVIAASNNSANNLCGVISREVSETIIPNTPLSKSKQINDIVYDPIGKEENIGGDNKVDGKNKNVSCDEKDKFNNDKNSDGDENHNKDCKDDENNAVTKTSKNIKDNNISIAFPFGIGCGMAKGDWSKYLAMINNFAIRHSSVKVVIYKLKN